MVLQTDRKVVLFNKQFSPRQLSGLQLWFDPSQSPITINTTPYAGTGVVSQTGTTLTGVGSAFLSEVKVGDIIIAVGINESVVSIASDTSLTLSGSLSSGAGLSYTITPVAGVSGRVSQINDLSSFAWAAAQATVAKQPALVAGVINSHSVLRFDGSNDVLIVSSFSGLNGLQKASIILVAQANSTAASKYVTALGGSDVVAIRNISTSVWEAVDSGDVGASSIQWTTPTNAFAIVTGTFDRSLAALEANLRVNGNAGNNRTGNANNTNTYTTDIFPVGGANATPAVPFSGDIAELIVVNRVLTVPEIAKVERYLNRKYALGFAV